jgi:hypothetical protein
LAADRRQGASSTLQTCKLSRVAARLRSKEGVVMEPLIIIVVPGLLGGILVALLILHVRRGPESAAPGRLEPPSPGLINMARIRINGIGGLGMVAMATTVAVFVPRIRATMTIALLLGAALAALLIAQRRRKGPLPSSSHHAGAHAMFVIDGEHEPASGRTS